MLATASGQASFAGQAVRKAHSKKPLDRPENEYIHFLAVRRLFFCPEALVAIFKLQAQIVCYYSQAGSPGAFFAAFFLRKKAQNPLCQFVFHGAWLSLGYSMSPNENQKGWFCRHKCCKWKRVCSSRYQASPTKAPEAEPPGAEFRGRGDPGKAAKGSTFSAQSICSNKSPAPVSSPTAEKYRPKELPSSTPSPVRAGKCFFW